MHLVFAVNSGTVCQFVSFFFINLCSQSCLEKCVCGAYVCTCMHKWVCGWVHTCLCVKVIVCAVKVNDDEDPISVRDVFIQ